MSELKAKAQEQLTASHEKMRQVLNLIQTSFEVYPTWTIKEVLAHIVGWDEAFLYTIRTFAKGEKLVTIAERGADFYNAESVATRTTLSLPQVIAEWEQARQDLLGLIETMTEEQLEGQVPAPWGGGDGPIHDLLVGLAAHEGGHAAEIESLFKDAGQNLTKGTHSHQHQPQEE